MKIIKNIKDFIKYRHSFQEKQIGFVPTMGALHAGHLSLIEMSIADTQFTVVSIFVNPTQFDNKNDLNNYPDLLTSDLKKLDSAGVNCVLLPNFDQIYPDNYNFSISEKELSKKYCGAHREGHFDGVLTIVMKLLNIVHPNKAYFGKKDFQQLTLIKQMITAFFIPIEIIAGPTIREEDGLAMSSRNLNLSTKERNLAPKLYQTINSNLSLNEMYLKLEKLGFKVDYLEVLNGHLLVAAFLGKVRLIDNVKLKKMDKSA
jgi:pantoate--beta-alanine ligase